MLLKNRPMLAPRTRFFHAVAFCCGADAAFGKRWSPGEVDVRSGAAAAGLVSVGHDDTVHDITERRVVRCARLARPAAELGRRGKSAVSLDDDALVATFVGDAGKAIPYATAPSSSRRQAALSAQATRRAARAPWSR